MLIAAEKLSKQYGEAPLLNDCSLFINEGEKIGIIGRNGAGKSTLLKLIAQKEQPDSGTITVHGTIRIGYLSQIPTLNDANTVLEQVMNDASEAGARTEEYEAKHILHKLNISDFSAPVGTCSGGQKKRVALASVLLSRCELLIMDEPTNHLDIATKESLDTALLEYTGTLLIVSHDRYLLSKIPDKIVEMHPDGFRIYPGRYADYLAAKSLETAPEESASIQEEAAGSVAAPKSGYRTKKQRSEDAARKRQLQELEKSIEDLELEIYRLENEIADPSLGEDYVALQERCVCLEEKRMELQDSMNRWAVLSEQMEKGSDSL